MTPLRLNRKSWTRRIIPGLFSLAGKVHDATGWLLLAAARILTAWLQPSHWSNRLGALFTLLASMLAWFFVHGRTWLLESSGFLGQQFLILDTTPLPGYFTVFEAAALPAALVCALAALLAFRRRPLSLYVARAAAWIFVAYSCGFMYFVSRVPAAIFNANDKGFSKAWRNELWINGFLFWVALLVLGGIALFSVYLRSSRAYYVRRPATGDLPSDRLIKDLKIHGGDPIYRTSMYWSAFAHVFILFILPVLTLRSCRMEKPYGVPQGSGVQTIGQAVVKMVRVKKPPKKDIKRFVFRPDSAISFYRPSMDDSKVLAAMEDATAEVYQATGAETGGATQGGKLGKGGGTKGGWPNGMENAKVRFIRLEYDGGDWDQDMGVGADYNLLVQFNKITGFQIADKTESLRIPQLKRFPKNRAPPFVFITGRGDINVNTAEVKAMRWYCLEEGGLIFADNGGGHFDTSIKNVMRRCFPELDWIDISNDDIIYRQPFQFPNGAPPLWHHGGTRALGMKYNGRWIVFYHPGDMNDAWKDGHSGVSKFLGAQSYKLGINVLNYAFNQYMGLHFKD